MRNCMLNVSSGGRRPKSVARRKGTCFPQTSSQYQPNLELQTGSVCTDDFDSPYLGWLFHLMSSSGEIGHPYFLFFFAQSFFFFLNAFAGKGFPTE